VLQPNISKERPPINNTPGPKFVSPLFLEQYRTSIMNNGFFVADLLNQYEIEVCQEELDRLSADNIDPHSKRKFFFFFFCITSRQTKPIEFISSCLFQD